MSNTRNPCWNLLHQTQVEKLGRTFDVHTLKSNQTVEDAVRLFSQNKILSAPVTDPTNPNQLVGMVDMLDLTHFILSVCPPDTTNQEDLERASRAMAFKELSEVMNTSGRDPPAPLNHNQPITLAIDLFASGIHRIPITDCDEKLVGLFSQSNLVTYLADHITRGKCKHMGSQTLRELGLGLGGVTSSPPTDSVLSLIKKLDTEGVSSVALIDPNTNQYVGNFSVTDLRGLWHELLPTFTLSAQEYLAQHHPQSLRVDPISTETATLEQVVQMMYQLKVHRLWTVDATGTPAGVVSMTDLMKLIRDYELMV